MDKTSNSFNIAICVVNFLNAWFLLIFSNVFDQPGLVTGIISIVLWILNAALTLILIIMIIISTTVIFFKGNPDARYHTMGDDRASFMKSKSSLLSGNSGRNNRKNDLSALGAVAARTLDDESDVDRHLTMARGALGPRAGTPGSTHNQARLHAPLMTTSPISPMGPLGSGPAYDGGAKLSREPSREPSPLSVAGSFHSVGVASNASGYAGNADRKSDRASLGPLLSTPVNQSAGASAPK